MVKILFYEKMNIFHLSENSVPFWNLKNHCIKRKTIQFKQEKNLVRVGKFFGSSWKKFGSSRKKIRFKQEKNSLQVGNFLQKLFKKKKFCPGFEPQTFGITVRCSTPRPTGITKNEGQKYKT